MEEGPPPGQQPTEEELQNMTPEQIAELQKQNCIFCHIVSGKVASKKIYEDERCTAILDINPANPGHIVIIPKEHYAIMPQIPEDVMGHMFMVAKGISHACLKAFKAQGTNIFVANGMIAGQRAQHFMLHIIPRKDNDGIAAFTIPHKEIAESDLEKLQTILKTKLNQMFGIKEEVLDLDKEKQEAGEPGAEDTGAGGQDTGGKTEEGAEETKEDITEEEVKNLLSSGIEEPEKSESPEEGSPKESAPEPQKEEESKQEQKQEEPSEIDLDEISDLFK
ncbi:HIT family protein [Thermoproteota archaeon]